MTTKRKMLIVDDDPMARRALLRTLADDDYEIVQASSPSEALGILAENMDIKVVVSDQHMGRETGAAFLSVVESKYPSIVRILLTSDTSTETFVSAVNEGHARRVLYKPWQDEQLSTVVRQGFGLPRRAAAKKPAVHILKEPSARTLTKLRALLGGERVP
jgi:DNA-binding NtrC family response regulator